MQSNFAGTFVAITAGIVAALAAACGGELPAPDPGGGEYGEAAKAVGWGGPAGGHYQLNIIGVPTNKEASMTNNDGRRLFVPLAKSANIWLQPGPFDVLDANGTDRDGARFQLPSPDPYNTGYTRYSVWARTLGKPGGSATMTTCALDYDGAEICSLESEVFVRSGGKPSAKDVSSTLLYMYVEIDGRVQRIPLFDSTFEDYFWQYDNDGLKLLQLRFYENPPL